MRCGEIGTGWGRKKETPSSSPHSGNSHRLLYKANQKLSNTSVTEIRVLGLCSHRCCTRQGCHPEQGLSCSKTTFVLTKALFHCATPHTSTVPGWPHRPGLPITATPLPPSPPLSGFKAMQQWVCARSQDNMNTVTRRVTSPPSCCAASRHATRSRHAIQ